MKSPIVAVPLLLIAITAIAEDRQTPTISSTCQIGSRPGGTNGSTVGYTWKITARTGEDCVLSGNQLTRSHPAGQPSMIRGPAECVSPAKAAAKRHADLLARLIANPDDDSLKQQAWKLLKERQLTDAEIGIVLNHAFHLVATDTGETTWWTFDRRTAPEFVYIQPRKYVLLRNGSVVAEKTVDITGNGVEVHSQRSGAGPFAGLFPKDADGQYQADEFRFHYEVTRAPSLKWLEGYENFLHVRLFPEQPPPAELAAPASAGPPQCQRCSTTFQCRPARVRRQLLRQACRRARRN